MAEVYIKNLGFAAGTPKSLEQLKADGALSGEIDFYRKQGYEQATVIEDAPMDFIEKNVPLSKDVDMLLYNTTFPRGILAKTDPKDNIPLVEKHMVYAGMKYLIKKERPELPYTGTAQQGCSGLLGAIDIAWMRVAAERNKKILCLSDDILPPGVFRSMEKSNMLLSDTVSYAEITSEPSRYRILNMTQGSIIQHHFLQIARDTELLLKTLCAGFADLQEIENILFPNHWRSVWASMMTRLKLSCRFEPCTIQTLAHGLSGDIAANLALYEEHGYITAGKKQIILAYGYGGHIRGMLIEAMEDRII